MLPSIRFTYPPGISSTSTYQTTYLFKPVLKHFTPASEEVGYGLRKLMLVTSLSWLVLKVLQDFLCILTQTNTAMSSNSMNMESTTFSRMEWKCINLFKTLAQIQTDIIFLNKCKQENVIPKGLQVKNPLFSTYHTDYSDKLCNTLSRKLLRHLINILYSKQEKIKRDISHLETQIRNQPFSIHRNTIYLTHFSFLKEKKENKLISLLQHSTTHNRSTSKPENNIVNLSNHILNREEESVLSRGLSFCPSKPTHTIRLCGDLEAFFRRLRLKEYFADRDNNQDNTQESLGSTQNNRGHQTHKKKNSTWTPPEGRSAELDLYIRHFRHRVQTEVINKRHNLPHNLNRKEKEAILNLKNNPNIVIKEADKGGAVVIMNRSDYTQEAERQLSNTTFYKILPKDPTEEYQKELNKLLKQFPMETQNQININTPQEPRPGTFYLLPKIHKTGNPGRPIVSSIGTLTVGASGYMDNILRPYATNTPSYVRDTTDFLLKLQSIQNLPSNTILATMDVESLYTNIPHRDGLQAIRNIIKDDTLADLTTKISHFVLTHNYFTFGSNIYLQINGTAMGTRMAPQYANIFMADLEQKFLDSCIQKPLIYLRYIDDIFLIWTHGEESLRTFHRNFTNFHPTINLSLEFSKEQVHFLDTTVLFQDGYLHTTIYRKPTDRYTYLHAKSFHPEHTTKSIVYSQALRYNRICTNPEDRDEKLIELKQAFLRLQYPPLEVEKQINKAKLIPRIDLLQNKPRTENSRTPLVVTYSSQLQPLRCIIRELQPILDNNTALSQALGGRPLLAYRQPPNLKQILTHSETHTTKGETGTKPCNKPRCQLCSHIDPGNTITRPNCITHNIRGSFTCSSSNVIYAISCQQCPSALYIGQTGQSLRQRINGHKSDIRHGTTEKPVAEHFNLPGHSISDLRTMVLEQKNYKGRLERETAELEYIYKLQTIENGLNKDCGFLNHYSLN